MEAPTRERTPRRIAVALLIAGAAVTLLAVAVAVHGDPLRGVVIGALGWAAALAVGLLRARAPGPAVAVAGALSMTAVVLQPVTLQPVPPVALLPFAVGVVVAMAAGARAWAIASVGAAYLVPLAVLFTSDSPLLAARGFGTMVILLVALGGGAFLRARVVRHREEAVAQAERRRRAVEEERLRIARELHDVLAHSLSSISVQAGVGLHLAGDRPAAATEALETIRTASRAALDEVRGVLGLLRGDESAPLDPGRGLDALPALVEETRRTGARVELVDRLEPRPALPVQLALYRVVQEALTNARRHAAGAAVAIVLDAEDGTAVARVRDRRPGARPAAPDPGNGIVGMRERAVALGGRLELVPHDDGLEVVARIPTTGTATRR